MAAPLTLLLFLGLARGWEEATATWYGSPNGAGTDGGACGYGQLPGTPYGLDVSAGSPPLFKNGKGCGECYLLKCFQQGLCSNAPVAVTITDECPGGYCSPGRVHFDLSGTAFGRLASSESMTSQLLASGVIQVLYTRIDCNFHRGISFQVNQGSSPYWFSVLVRYEDGPGDLGMVEIMEVGGSGAWLPMNQIWGANWCINSGGGLHAPFSFRVSTLSPRQSLVAFNVVPGDWSVNMTYTSNVNFQVLDRPHGYHGSYPDYNIGSAGPPPGAKKLFRLLGFVLVVLFSVSELSL